MRNAKANLLSELGVAGSEPTTDSRPLPACVLLGHSSVELFGLTGEERLRRGLARAGVNRVYAEAEVPDGLEGDVLLLRADYVFEEPLFANLLKASGAALCAEGESHAAAMHVPAARWDKAKRALCEESNPDELGLTRHTPVSLSGDYNKQLRKRSPFYLCRATAERKGELEKLLFAGSYKGVTDIVSKFVWPFPARHVTAWAAWLGITPNMVTTVGLVLTLWAFWLFWQGHFAAGLFAGWVMTFLDTVDGKLARVTLNSSRFGNIFDHSIDLIHPPFWYWAWVHGLGPEFGARTEASVVLAVIVAGYVLQRLQEAFFMGAFRLEMHIWRRFDSYFRTITARRNPNMVILSLSLLFAAPSAGIHAVAIWTVICLGVHMLQIAQAGVAKVRGQPIQSWLDRV